MEDRLHPFTLRFRDPATERAWRASRATSIRWALNLTSSVIVVMLVVSTFRDALLRWEGWQMLLALRWGVIAPLALTPWVAVRTKWGLRHSDAVVFGCLAALFGLLAAAVTWSPSFPDETRTSLAVLFLPIAALAQVLFPLDAPRRVALLVLGASLCSAVLLATGEPSLLRAVLLWTVIVSLSVLAVSAWSRERSLRTVFAADRAKDAAERAKRDLLENVFPAQVVDRLLEEEAPFADHHDELLVLFADVVGFVAHSRTVPANALVAQLDGLFTDLDALTARYGFTKVKTIGDAYMVVGGLPWEPTRNLASAGAALGAEMLATARETHQLQMRVGLHLGPVVAGVIGRQRLLFDVWGETVNLASRLESASAPDRILASAEVVAALEPHIQVQQRGPMELKGAGRVDTFWLSPQPIGAA